MKHELRLLSDIAVKMYLYIVSLLQFAITRSDKIVSHNQAT